VKSTTRRATAALALLLCGGCASDPDVVARARDDGLTGFENVVSDCEVGAYRGAFSTTKKTDGVGLELSGEISFSLIKSERGGEFLRIGDTELKGVNSDNTASFAAVIATGECKEGSYKTTITGGEFLFLLPDGGPAGPPVEFSGTISGEYILEKHTFFGEWTTTTTAGLTNGGRWAAFLVE
jgi:hypothetical protein